MAQQEAPRFNLQELLGSGLLVKSAGGKPERAPIVSLDGKFFALYFSADWCPPCRAFTPQLARTYAALKGRQPFEVVFVSSDRSADAFADYYSSMPWAAVPFEEQAVRQRLSAAFRVSGIPSLVVLAPDGRLINSSARGSVAADPDGTRFPWPGIQSVQQGSSPSPNNAIILLLLLHLAYRYFFA